MKPHLRINSPLSRLSPSHRTSLQKAIGAYVQSIPDGIFKTSLQSSIWKKFVDQGSTSNLSLVAKRAFLETEKLCAHTNVRIRSAIHTSYADQVILHLASRKISQILGKFSVEEMCNRGRFGPGSTFLCRGDDVSWSRKFSLCDVSGQFKKTASWLIPYTSQKWAESLVDQVGPCSIMLDDVRGGRYTTVPKNATTDRSIIVEPTINSYFQQGLGRMIRSRLKRKVAVDLDDQSTNQRLAHYASIHQDIATVDLSNASDLISTRLVEDLFQNCPEWYEWLNLTRSREVKIDGKWVRLEKFSSMGNGFTFDLQSLIFYALAWATCVKNGVNPFWVNVFGDDIVIPSIVEEEFKTLFSDCGFCINDAKSFFAGSFRESCGHDYHNGVNVRGVYCYALDTWSDVMKLHNRFSEWSVRSHISSVDLRRFLFRSSPADMHYRVPASLGDCGWHSSFDESTPPVARGGWEGFRIRCLSPVLRKGMRDDRFLLLQRLVSIGGEVEEGNVLSLRLEPIGYREIEIISRWDT